jgi:TonB family protein
MSTMAAWFLYAMVIANLLGLAAVAGESALRGSGRSGRLAWALAMTLSAVLPVLAWLGLGMRSMPAVPASVLIPIAPIALPSIQTVSGPTPGLNELLGWLWVATAVGAVLFTALSWLSVRRERKSWHRRQVDGVTVMVTQDRGPAVYGVRRAEILLPEWALKLEQRVRRLMLLHEGEHARAGDARLMVYGLAILSIAPWNLPLWWHFRRLREAIELDCDARVLRRVPDARRYGALLLEVGRRRSSPVLGVALAEPASFLERRIRMITNRAKNASVRRVFSMASLATLLVAAAICTRDPLAPGRAAAAEAPPLISVSSMGPVFTPFTVPPRMLNRDEVGASLDREYPEALRKAGIGGVVQMWFHLGADGEILQTRLSERSGYPSLDEAAKRVASTARFSPALNGQRPVSVWVSMPVQFAAALARSESSRPATGAIASSATERKATRVDGFDEQIERLSGQLRNSMPGGTPALVTAQAAEERVRGSTIRALSADAPMPVAELAHDNIVSMPPRRETRKAAGNGPTSTPFTSPPRLRNGDEISRALEREYPVLLRTSGVSGTVKVWFHVDADGVVQETVVGETSGFASLDAAALRVARDMKFTPALNGRDNVAAWVSLPIRFSTR